MLGRYLNQELIRDFCILYYSIKYVSNINYSEVLVNKKYFNTAQILFISTLWTKHKYLSKIQNTCYRAHSVLRLYMKLV